MLAVAGPREDTGSSLETGWLSSPALRVALEVLTHPVPKEGILHESSLRMLLETLAGWTLLNCPEEEKVEGDAFTHDEDA